MKVDTRNSHLLFTPGVALMPDDFPQRLTSIKEAAGLSWQGFSACLGVDGRQVLRWRKGAVPCGGAMLDIFRLASTVPGGVPILLGGPVFGSQSRGEDQSSYVPVTPGAALMPDDFPDRLAALKSATGLSWEGFSTCLGVDCRQVLRWRKGSEPCGGAMLALCRLAAAVPGGQRALLSEVISTTPQFKEGEGQ